MCSLWGATRRSMYYLWDPRLVLAVPWLWRLFTDHLPRRPGFDPISAHARFVVEKVALGEIFLRVLPSFSCYCHSTNAPHSSPSTHCSYQKDKRAKPRNLPQNSSLSETAELGTEMYLHFFICYSVQMCRKWKQVDLKVINQIRLQKAISSQLWELRSLVICLWQN